MYKCESIDYAAIAYEVLPFKVSFPIAIGTYLSANYATHYMLILTKNYSDNPDSYRDGQPRINYQQNNWQLNLQTYEISAAP
jgi:hypothetical protein